MFIRTNLPDVIRINSIISLHCFDYCKSFRFSGDVHDFWELVYVDSGEVGIQSDTNECILHSGEALFHKPGEYHNIWANNTFASVVIISFDTESPAIHFFDDFRAPLTSGEKDKISEILCEGVKTYFGPFDVIEQTQLIRRADAPFGAEQVIRTLMEQLLIDIIRENSKNEPCVPQLDVHSKRTGCDYLVSDILAILDSKVCDQISLEELSKQLNFSVSHIKTVFKKETGNTIYNTFLEKKISYSKKLLSEDSRSITEISEILGFNSVHHYSRKFKEITGMTPTEYLHSVRKRALL